MEGSEPLVEPLTSYQNATVPSPGTR
jgi:hypothetical protein